MTIYKLSGGEKGESLVVVYEDGEPASIPGTHPKFDDILTLLRSGSATDEAVKVLVNTLHVAGTRLAQLTDRVSVAPYGVFFDGDPLRSELADVLTQLLEEDNETDLKAVAKFLENAAANQTMEGVDAMYRWISNRDLHITEDGMFLAYKGVRFSDDEEGTPTSITQGKAFVDGVAHEGSIPNPIGSIITMPRSEVTSETSVGCGPGLHAGTYDYANMFGHGKLILVEINPRDVVSVPSDSSYQKLRVSRYKVVKKVDERLGSVFYNEQPVSDGDFTETGEVDEQPEVSFKDELEGLLAAPEDGGIVNVTKPEEKDADDLDIDGHESQQSKLKRFSRWLKGE